MTPHPKRQVNLDAVDSRVRMWLHGGAPPRHLQGLLAAVLYLALVLLVPIPQYPYVKTALLLLVPGAVWVLVMKFSTASRSHADQLDKLLAVYEPKDLDAYRTLQDEARKRGELELGMVKIWLGREKEACAPVLAPPPPKPLRFVERKV